MASRSEIESGSSSSVGALSERLRPFHDQLNRIPFLRAIVLGLALGIAVGFASGGGGFIAFLGIAALAGLALAAGWNAEPVWVEDAGSELPDLFEMVEIEDGTFWMGSPQSEVGRNSDERHHQVKMSGFRIGATVVTREQFREILGREDAPGPGGPGHPVTQVSWFDAIRFCNDASAAAGFEPCYRIVGDEVIWNRRANGYRLPTEAEWEYAARAGISARWFFGDDEERLGEHAWFRGNSGGTTQPVAELTPNPWGLYDVHGNVWEWCWDAQRSYPRLASLIPKQFFPVAKLKTNLSYLILRGGSAWSGVVDLRSAARLGSRPGVRNEYTGFRCARSSDLSPWY